MLSPGGEGEVWGAKISGPGVLHAGRRARGPPNQPPQSTMNVHHITTSTPTHLRAADRRLQRLCARHLARRRAQQHLRRWSFRVQGFQGTRGMKPLPKTLNPCPARGTEAPAESEPGGGGRCMDLDNNRHEQADVETHSHSWRALGTPRRARSWNASFAGRRERMYPSLLPLGLGLFSPLNPSHPPVLRLLRLLRSPSSPSS
jgi:hypothetical protein